MLQWTVKKRTETQAAPAARRPQTDASGPSLAELAAGAMPSAEQMGRRVELPGAVREKMEASFGADFSGVKLYESQTVADAGAKAMTMGSNIAFAPGRLDLASTSGQALLGHELSHVVSQARGESAGRGFLADAGLEAQADRQGALAAQGESVYSGPVTPLSAGGVPASAAGPMQADKETSYNPGPEPDDKQMDRLIRMRPWKRDVSQGWAENNNVEGERDLFYMDPDKLLPPVDKTQTDDENLENLQDAFSVIVGHKVKGHIPSGLDPHGVRERLVEMLRMQQSVPQLRHRITSFETLKGEGSMSTSFMESSGKSESFPLRFSADRMQSVNDWKYIDPQRLQDPANNPKGLNAEQVKENNETWYWKRYADDWGWSTADVRFSGTHEQGHMVSSIVHNIIADKFDKQEGNNHGGHFSREGYSQEMYAGGSVASYLLTQALAKAAQKEQKQNPNGPPGPYQTLYNQLKLQTTEEKPNIYFGAPGRDNSLPLEYEVQEPDGKGGTRTVMRRNKKTGKMKKVKRRRRTDMEVTEKVKEGFRREAADNPDSDMGKFLHDNPHHARARKLAADDSDLAPMTQGQQNLYALYQIGAISRYGATNPEEAVAEAIADVSAHGKDARLYSKVIYKIYWDNLNKSAADEAHRRHQVRNGLPVDRPASPPAPAGTP